MPRQYRGATRARSNVPETVPTCRAILRPNVRSGTNGSGYYLNKKLFIKNELFQSRKNVRGVGRNPENIGLRRGRGNGNTRAGGRTKRPVKRTVSEHNGANGNRKRAREIAPLAGKADDDTES